MTRRELRKRLKEVLSKPIEEQEQEFEANRELRALRKQALEESYDEQIAYLQQQIRELEAELFFYY